MSCPTCSVKERSIDSIRHLPVDEQISTVLSIARGLSEIACTHGHTQLLDAAFKDLEANLKLIVEEALESAV